jgi:hypothetical protein
MLKILNVLALVFALSMGIAYCNKPVQDPKFGYDSYCLDGDYQCINREINFIAENHRNPGTDMELVVTYNLHSNEELFETPANQYHTIRPLPVEITDCDDCEIWDSGKYGPAQGYSISNLP